MIRRFVLLVLTLWLGLLAGCGDSAPPAEGGPWRVGLQLNWVPEPEFGGYYAAREAGDYRAEGLELDIRPGGPGVPGLQMVAAGQVEFGITSADSLLVARARGADVVAVFALYQTFPEGIMVHAGRGLRSIAEVFEGGTLAMEPGTPYFRLLERRFGFGRVRVVPYGNNLGPFLHDPLFAQQCFVTAEPIAARRAGVETRVFPLSEIGYNPYAGVIFARRALVEAHPERIADLVRATRRGWQRYLDDPEPTNQLMHRLNPTMDPATFREAAAIQKPLILGDADRPPGVMTLARWRALAEQLRELGLIDRVEPERAFVDPE